MVLTNCTIGSIQEQEVEMEDQKEKKSCLDDEIMYPHGSKSCKDLYWDDYCFKCNDGKWEMQLE
jgi:hypothetical protein